MRLDPNPCTATLTLCAHPELLLVGGSEGLETPEPPVYALLKKGNIFDLLRATVPGCGMRDYCQYGATWKCNVSGGIPSDRKEQAKFFLKTIGTTALSNQVVSVLVSSMMGDVNRDSDVFRAEIFRGKGMMSDTLHAAVLISTSVLECIPGNLLTGGLDPVNQELLGQIVSSLNVPPRVVSMSDLGTTLAMPIPVAGIGRVGSSIQVSAPCYDSQYVSFLEKSVRFFGKQLGTKRKAEWMRAGEKTYA